MSLRGSHTENRKFRRYSMRSKTGKYIVKCPFCDNSYTVSIEMGGKFVCPNCCGVADLSHVTREITAQEWNREVNDFLSDDFNDEIDDLREEGNRSKGADKIRDIMEHFVYAVATNDKAYILSKLYRYAGNQTMTEEQIFSKFKMSAFGKYLGDEKIRLKKAAYLNGYPWPDGFSYFQAEIFQAEIFQAKSDGGIDYDGDGIPDTDIKGYQHFEVILTDGEVFDVYFFEGVDGDWKLRIL